jgi:hypothetical protein
VAAFSGAENPFTRGLVEKVDANGTPLWALAYAVSASTSINQVRQTTDGGYIAVGSAQNVDGLIAALVLKLDANGAVQWQRELGSGTTAAYFNAVLQTSDGGYVVLGESYVTGTPLPVTSVLLVAFSPDGTVRWQQNYNSLDSADLSPLALSMPTASDIRRRISDRRRLGTRHGTGCVWGSIASKAHFDW